MQETLYKAVRPDGTDFYTDTVQWLPEENSVGKELGYVVKHPHSTRVVLGDHFTSLAVTNDPTIIPGARWPLRLCKVHPVADVEYYLTDEYKRQSLAWWVMEELPAAVALGPQYDLARHFVNNFYMSSSEVTNLISYAEEYSQNNPCVDFNDAYQLDAAASLRCPSARWVENLMRSSPFVYYGYKIGDIVRETLMALLLRDTMYHYFGSVRTGISQETYDNFTTPWRTVMGPIHPDDKQLKGI